MAFRLATCAAVIAATTLAGGCSSPFDVPRDAHTPSANALPIEAFVAPESAYRDEPETDKPVAPELTETSTLDEYVRYALYHSPSVEAAYQNWRASAERLPQVAALPDPRLTFGFFLDEVETRTGAQQARVGVQQSFPWVGKLKDRKDAASRAATASWRQFEATRLVVAERVVISLYELAYLDAATEITQDNLELLESFEEVLRTRYRVGAGSHPELIRVQVELGQLTDRLIQLRAMRPVYTAELNAALHRPSNTDVPKLDQFPGRVVLQSAETLIAIARRANPELIALGEQIEEQRYLAQVARKDGLPDLTVGLDYTFTNEAIDASIPESGDDPILLTFGMNVPLWRDKYKAGVRESTARRLSIASQRNDRSNRIAASIQRAWFDHTDANRRVQLYEQILIPKAEESLKASLVGFRAGETSFLDLLDTERTLLEFAIAAERARADRGKALARLNTLVGEPVETYAAQDQIIQDETHEVQP